MAQKTIGMSMKWEIVAELPSDSGQQTALGVAGPVVSIHKGMLFIAGGANFPIATPWQGGIKKFHTTINVFSTNDRKLTVLKKNFSLPDPIAYAATCNTPDGVLYAGGENENGITDKVWLMAWDDKTEELFFKKMSPLPFPVSNASIALIGNKVYLAGGETIANSSKQFLSLDLADISKGWKNLADIPQPMSHMVMAYSSAKKANKIYLCGGRKKNSNGISDIHDNVFVYNVAADKWEEKKALPYVLSAGTGMMINANSIILFGGDRGVEFSKTEKLIAAINTENDPEKRQKLIEKKNKLQSEHPGFSREVLLYNVKNDTWKILGTMPFETPVTTAAVKWKSGVLIPSGEIRAGIRSPKILMVKFEK